MSSRNTRSDYPQDTIHADSADIAKTRIPTISVIVPTYNEAENIVPLVESLHRVFSGTPYEIIVIDDNSQDGTGALAEKLSHRYPVKLVVRKDKRGLASAVVDGFEKSSGRILAVIDADMQHPPEVLADLHEAINNGADIAIASRYVPGGGCEGWGLARRLISKGATFLAHLLLPSTRQVKDPMSGFFMLNKGVIADCDLEPTGYKILLEILNLGQYQKVTEVPYTFRNRQHGRSKLSARQQVDYLGHVFSLMRRSGELLRFFKFCLVGLSGVGVNTGILWALTERLGLFYLASSSVAIETSIISNYLLNNAFTFRDRRSKSKRVFFRRFFKFNLISAAGIAINLGILYLFTSVFGLYYLLSNLIGIAVATIWNYLVNSWWTWQ